MDAQLDQKIKQKIQETFENVNEINQIIDSLSHKSDSFAYGLVVGRLYNSFYYQCRRILKRSPTEEEFHEFLQLLKTHESEFIQKFESK